MPANAKPKTPFPVRGTPGGWRDPWDEPIDHAALRAEAEAAERELKRRAEATRLQLLSEQEAERREALRMLLDMGQPLRAGLPDAMAGLVRFPASDPDDLAEGITREEWQDARDMLMGNGFLEPGELATFPVESLVAIARDRFNQREQT